MSDISWWPEDGPPESERLQQLGWDQARDEEFAHLGEPGKRAPGRIARVDRGICTVFAATAVHRAAVLPRFETPAVGDWAAAAPGRPGRRRRRPAGADGTANRIHAAGPSGEETIGQVVAANIDVVFLVNSLDQRFSLRRLERT